MGVVNEIILQASAAQTQNFQATGVSTATLNRVLAGTSTGTQSGVMFIMDSVSASSGTNPTLKVAIQGKGNYSGASWGTIAGLQFESVTGSANANAYQTINYLGALPPNLRAIATIGGTTPSFTLAVIAEAIG